MSTDPSSHKLRVVIAGGGVAGLETALALRDLAPDRTEVSVLAPDADFVYRPMVVREPFGYSAARRYPLAPIVQDAGATLIAGRLGWVDAASRVAHTEAGESLEYDALVVALGATVTTRYQHALTLDDHDLDKTMHGLIQDVEGDYIRKLAFVVPGRIAWPLPLYELALMTAGRAYDMGITLQTTIVTPEDSHPCHIWTRGEQRHREPALPSTRRHDHLRIRGDPTLRRSGHPARRKTP